MKLYQKLFALIICAALLLCAFPVGASAESDFPTVLAEAKKGVVQIYGVGESGIYISSWIGTGFAVGEEGTDSNVFLTNWHVVTSSGEYELDKVRIWILQENCEISESTLEPDPNNSIECEVLKTTTGYPDYAIIRATEPVSGYKPLKLLSSEAVPDGLTVYALGYPAIVGQASASHYGIDDITSTNGIISQHMQYGLAENTWVLMHTAQISGGNSGGPLITEEGAVVGLNTYGFGESGGEMNRYCAVYIDYAMEGLDELGLPYEVHGEQASADSTESSGDGEQHEETTPDDKDDEEEDDKLIILLAAGGAVLLIGAVVVFIILKRKKEEQEALRRQEEYRRRQEEERRRQEAEERRQAEARRQEEERRQAEARRQAEERNRRAQEVKAQLQLNGGTIYPVRASGCVIGREPDCSIVLPSNAPGVSRHHCKLEFREGQLLLIDTNSSHGTYIHGKRIPANTPVILKPGSSFCLGSEACKFTVC